MSDFVRETLAKAAVVISVVLCLLMSGALFVDYAHASKFGNDFAVYWRTANQPAELAYLWEGRFPFPYAPTMLLWIAPLSLTGPRPAFFLLCAASIAAFILAFRPYLPRTAIALCLISPPFVRGISTGQVSALLAALMIWACGSANRIAAGMAFGFIASIKPHLVIMAPLMFVLNRDWRAFGAAAFTFLIVVAGSVILFGPSRWPEWIASMDHFHGAVVETNVLDNTITLAALAERLGLRPLPFIVLGMFGGGAVVYLCRSAPPLEKFTAIALGSLLAAPYAMSYDLITVVPLLALTILRGRIFSALAIASPLHPLPMLISTYELLHTIKLPFLRANPSST
jgi:hypothetical protein